MTCVEQKHFDVTGAWNGRWYGEAIKETRKKVATTMSALNAVVRSLDINLQVVGATEEW